MYNMLQLSVMMMTQTKKIKVGKERKRKAEKKDGSPCLLRLTFRQNGIVEPWTNFDV